MFSKVTFCVAFFVVIVNSENHVEKNDFHYKVDGDVYRITNALIPILGEGSVSDLEDVVVLQFFNVHLEEIEPGAFQNLPKLKWLDISRNSKLIEIKFGVFNNLTNLTTLFMIKNNISVIAPNAFDNMVSLEQIVLSNNNLQHWNPDWFFNTPSLDGVFANYNPLGEIPARAFKNLRKDKMVSIYLNGCDIRRIDDDAFEDLKWIRILALERNKLETLSGKYLRGVKIDEFRVNNNQIRCQTGEDLDIVFVANTTRTERNPWDKDCLKRIIKWAQRSNKTVIV